MWTLALCRHANHVVQELIRQDPKRVSLIANAVSLEELICVSKHRFGCRVVERLIETSTFDTEKFIALQRAVPELIYACFGVFVVQVLVESHPDLDIYILRLLADKKIHVCRTNAYLLTDVVRRHLMSPSNTTKDLVMGAVKNFTDSNSTFKHSAFRRMLRSLGMLPCVTSSDEDEVLASNEIAK
jgi:hypothetical protein